MDSKKLRFILELFVNIALPWAAYTWAKPHWGEVGGLLASAAPPMLWSLFELARSRRVDALSMIVLGGIALSLVALLLGGDARILLVRESLVSGLVGVAFLLSLFMPKPLIFYLAKATVMRDNEDGADIIDEWWSERQSRHSARLMTLVWGAGLTGEASLRAWLAWRWTPERYLAITPFISYGIIGILMLWTLWYRRQLSKTQP